MAHNRTHQTHCCKDHGCKYGDKECPIVLGELEADFICEECNEESNQPSINFERGGSVVTMIIGYTDGQEDEYDVELETAVHQKTLWDNYLHGIPDYAHGPVRHVTYFSSLLTEDSNQLIGSASHTIVWKDVRRISYYNIDRWMWTNTEEEGVVFVCISPESIYV